MELKLTKKQASVLKAIQENEAEEILYGGAAGGGKSWLLRALAIIWAIQVPGVQIFLFRRKVKDLVATHMRGPSSFPVLLKEFEEDKLCKINNSNNYIEFDNGSIISLNHLQHPSDLNNYLSAEIHILLLDEATTFEEKMIRFLRSRLRIAGLEVPEQLKGTLPFAVYATNPRGVSHAYLKRGFVDANTPGEAFIAPKDDGAMRRLFVQSFISDNPHIEEGYEDKLRGLGDPDVVDAYLSGDWSIMEGLALPRISRKYHVIPNAWVCPSLKVQRAYDYGYSAPYFVIFYMVATGESSTIFNPPKDSIIIHSDIYGANKRDEGLKEDVAITARKILAHELIHFPHASVHAGPADNSIFDAEQGPSIQDQMLEAVPSCEFTTSDKSPGSRLLGLTEIRKLLYNAIAHRHERPGIYFTDLALTTFTQLSGLQLDEKKVEDVDSASNDHSYDVVRYIALDKSLEVSTIPTSGT